MDKKTHEKLQTYLVKSRERQEKEGLAGRMEQLSKMYNIRMNTGGNISDWDTDSSIIKVNKVYPNVRTSLSALFAKKPDIMVKPRKPESQETASSAECLLNYLTYYLKYPAEIRLCLTYARLLHYGVVKLFMRKVRGVKLPTMEAVHPLSVRFDPFLERFEPERGRWAAFKFKRTIAALRESGRYDESQVDKLAAMMSEEQGPTFDEDTTEVVLWEHYLKSGNKVNYYVQVEDRDFYLVDDAAFTPVAGLPFRVLSFSDGIRQDGWFPLSPVEQWGDQQKELNSLRTDQLVHAGRASRKYVYNKDAITEDEAMKFTSTEDQTFIQCTGSPEAAVAPLEAANLSADVYAVEARIENSIQEISGIGSMQMGGEQKVGSKSATEASIVESNLRLRASDNQEIFEDWLESVYDGLLNLAQDRMDGEVWIMITGLQPIPISRTEIQGDMDVRISFGSTLPSDREREWEQAKEMYAIAMADPGFNKMKARQYLLNKRADIKDPNAWLIPEMPMPGMAPGMPGEAPMEGPPQSPEAPQAMLGQAAQEGAQGQMPALDQAALMRQMGPFV